MPINFPSSPAVDQTYVYGARTYKYDGEKWTTIASPVNPDLLANENRIINGAFDFWQRGTSHSTSGYGSADRWKNVFSGGSSTLSRQSFTLGDKLGRNTPSYFARVSVSGQTLSSHGNWLVQDIEDVRSYAGETITVLGWVRRSSVTGNIALEVSQAFGTGDSPSSPVYPGVNTISLTGSWAPFAATYTLPSISGKTLGSDGNNRLVIHFWISAGSDFNSRSNSLGLQTIGVDLWGIHIRVGTHTTAACDDYIAPELGPELERCQRYYEKSYNVDVNPGTVTEAGAVCQSVEVTQSFAQQTADFSVQKRATPNITIYSTVTGASGKIRTQIAAADVNAIAQKVGTRSFTGVVNGVSVSAVDYILFQWAADAEL
jgi:hypothetical protein